MPSILFISKGEKASSTRYRVTDYLPYWQASGWTTAHVTHDGSLRCWPEILRRARQADVVVILRRTFRFPFLNLLRSAARTLVFDFDDAIFVRGSGQQSASKYARFGRTLSACDLVWAGNRYLAGHAAKFCDQVVVVPTALDPGKYLVSPPKPDDTFDLVWIGSSATRKHLAGILPALEKAAARVPNLRLRIVADFTLPTERLVIDAVPWSSDGEAHALATAHVGIAPLPDNPFTRGKCGLKILQYMAAGLPVIASPVGVNADLVRPDVTGYTVTDDGGWPDAIERLAGDPDLRRRMGEQGRQDCTAHYTLDKVFKLMADSLGPTGIGETHA
ncbi:MAG: glycosyltransferase family 4 protein [Gammaproteobacteria bacterium]|nr:glycosyltransferase family 4 protein [Gammaproteobacteria bacterium]